MVSKEVVLYLNSPYKKYRWIGIVSTIQISFVLSSLVLMPSKIDLEERQTGLKNKDERKGENSDQASSEPRQQPQNVPSVLDSNVETSTLWQRFQHLNYNDIFSLKNIKENIVERPYFTFGMLGATSLISSAFIMYARRMAHIITLLPGERIRFESFSTFALMRPPRVELPAKDISCVMGRKSANNYSILKFRGYFGYHLVHKSEGSFLEPRLYDEYLGYARSWYKK